MSQPRRSRPRAVCFRAFTWENGRTFLGGQFVAEGIRVFVNEGIAPIRGEPRAACRKRKATVTTVDRLVTCTACLRLVAMSPEEWRAHRDAEQAKAKQVFDRLAGKRREQDEQARRERVELVESTREEALIAIDAIAPEHGGPRTSDEHELVARVCKVAVTAHRLANPKSRGNRLWVLRDVGKDGRERGIGDVCCRFCGEVLAAGVQVGADRTVYGNRPAVSGHTVRCAVHYLAGDLAPRESIDASSNQL